MNDLLQIDLGAIPYAEAWELQKRVVAARKAGAIEDVLLFCEHPHVITLGRSGKRANLLAGEDILRQKGVEYFEATRGGDITYHGPGQIVGYPILDLAAIRRDVVWYVRALEEAMIRATAQLGIAARREAGRTGIWVGEAGREEKLAAIGIHLSRWVSSHGFAYNVATDLGYFDLIVPCGIRDRKATSVEKLLGRSIPLAEIKPLLAKHLSEVFALRLRTAECADLRRKLAEFDGAMPVSVESSLVLDQRVGILERE